MKHGIISRIKLAGDRERGVVLPIVIGLGLAMLMLVAVGMTSAASGTIKTNTDEDIKGAISAAFAGVQDYQSRLALDSTYYKYGNPAAPFSASSSGSLSVPIPANYNPAFDATSSGNWGQIPNPNPLDPEPDRRLLPLRGRQQRLLDQGRDPPSLDGQGRQRHRERRGEPEAIRLPRFSVLHRLRDNGPDLRPCLTPPAVAPNCEVYVYNGRDSSCGQIQFGKFDTLAGPVHSNDTMLICSTTFLGTVTTSNPTTPIYQTASGGGCGAPVFKNPDLSPNPSGAVIYEKPLTIPPTNANMKSETYTDIPADVPNPGCLYTGPTTITFLGNGKMNVVSPYTKAIETNTTRPPPPRAPPSTPNAARSRICRARRGRPSRFSISTWSMCSPCRRMAP